MAFHDIRLPTDIERGAVGGTRFKTTVLELSSGFEKRNIDWSQARGEWDVGYGLVNKSTGDSIVDLDELINFFYARQGRAHSFRFKDWADFEIGDILNPTTDNQSVGTGDGANDIFNVFKRYTSGAENYDRPLTKLVAGTPIVLLDDVVQGSGFTLDVNTGVLDFTSPPGGGVDVGLASEFDNHVRFNTDSLDLNVVLHNVGSWPTIPIVELRGTGL